jgi:hypothetical protein
MSGLRALYSALALSLILLAHPSKTLAQTGPCSPSELKAALPSIDPSYAHAVELAGSLRARGVSVKCILTSTMENDFDGQEGAATYITGEGDSFEACFLSQPNSFARMRVIAQRKGGRYLYRFEGPPARSGDLANSAFPMYFVAYNNVLFVIGNNKALAKKLEKLTHSMSANRSLLK